MLLSLWWYKTCVWSARINVSLCQHVIPRTQWGPGHRHLFVVLNDDVYFAWISRDFCYNSIAISLSLCPFWKIWYSGVTPLFVASFTPLSCEDRCLITPRPLLRDHSGGVAAPLQSTSEVHVPAQSWFLVQYSQLSSSDTAKALQLHETEYVQLGTMSSPLVES